MACHGDQGQGLTAEFRDLYPPDHVDCWKSGCHGPHPYENGFTLPRTVPAVIGPGALDAFHTAGDLYRFIHTAMPFQAPGRLADDAYWQVTAFLLRQNGFASGPEPLGPQDADTIIVGRGLRSPVPTVAAKPATIEAPAPVTTAAQGPSGASFFLGLAAVMIVVAGAALWARARRRRPHP
jgi:hypothetical protein